MKQLVFIFLAILLALISGCTKQSQSEMALEFNQTGKYELLSDEDKAVYTKSEFESFWGRVMDISLEPTSKYFDLEKYLKALITFKVKIAKENEVVVTTFYPKVLSELYFMELEYLNEEELEKLENLYLAHQKQILDISDFKFGESDTTYNFVSSGIYLDLTKVKINRDNAKKISVLDDSVKSITDKSVDLMMLAFDHSTIDKFNSLLESAKNLEKNIEKCTAIKNKILAIDPERSTYSIDSYIEASEKILDIRNKFYVLKNNIVFKDVEISKTTSGDLAIFGNFEYKGKENIKYSHFIAKFLDKSGNIIATQNLEYFARDLFTGKLKSFALKIKDQFIAKSANKVLIEPIAVF